MKKIILSVAGAAVLIAGGIIGYTVYKNSRLMPYGSYYGTDFNGQPSYLTLDAEHITFTNVDFSSCEAADASILYFQEKMQGDKSNIDDAKEKAVRIEEIKQSLHYCEAFNGKTFDATDYRDEGGVRSLVVYDPETDSEIWLNVNRDSTTVMCGHLEYRYKD